MKYQEIGEDSLTKIKLTLLVFALSGCTLGSIKSSYTNTIDYFNKDFINQEILINTKDRKAIISLNDGDEFIGNIVLTNKNYIKWHFSNDIELNISNSKIIRSKGLNYDFEIINLSNKALEGSGEAYLNFFSPKSGYLIINYEYIEIESGAISDRKGVEIDYKLIQENFTVPRLRWSGQNYYWLNDNNEIIKLKQQLNPFKEYVEIDFINTKTN